MAPSAWSMAWAKSMGSWRNPHLFKSSCWFARRWDPRRRDILMVPHVTGLGFYVPMAITSPNNRKGYFISNRYLFWWCETNPRKGTFAKPKCLRLLPVVWKRKTRSCNYEMFRWLEKTATSAKQAKLQHCGHWYFHVGMGHHGSIWFNMQDSWNHESDGPRFWTSQKWLKEEFPRISPTSWLKLMDFL